MRTLVKISIPVEGGNDAVKNGSMAKILAESMEKVKPEAAYFYTDEGKRTVLLVIDFKNVADMPMIAEPFFQGFNAAVSFSPVMNQDDLKLGLTRT